MFDVNDRVMVVTHEPDEDFRESGEIPIGTEGIIAGLAGTAPHPETNEDEQTYWVDFDLPHEEHRWTTDRAGLVRACMFESMLALVDAEVYEVRSIEELF